jgi:hypothetical protein
MGSGTSKYAAWFGGHTRFWQSKYSLEIYGPQLLEEKLDYMHLNPVRAGLAMYRCLMPSWVALIRVNPNRRSDSTQRGDTPFALARFLSSTR